MSETAKTIMHIAGGMLMGMFLSVILLRIGGCSCF